MKYYAKSEPEESIKEHTNQLLREMRRIKRLYGEEILRDKKFSKDRFWKLLEIICTYHDMGKVYTPFQNMIRGILGLKRIPTRFNYEAVKHEELSPLFIPIQKFNLTRDEEKLVYQVIFYHHEREKQVVDNRLVEQIIKEDILPQIEDIEKETGIEVEKNPNALYLMEIGSGKRDRIHEQDELYEKYCLLKGLLHRLDHASSAGIKVEDDTKEEITRFVEDKIKPNELQQFAKKNQNNNLLVIGSTGIGKTEAALLWSGKSKGFFTLPIRISINAIFDRIYNEIGYHHVGLLHSTALDYLEEKEEFKMEDQIYEQSKNLAQKITVCTIDQIFTFVFKYKGYEKMYATLSYSKVIIDEIQAYCPEIVAVILKGLQMIHKIGGKFMIMTATLPAIYKEQLEKMKIDITYGKYTKDIKRHRICMQQETILEDIDKIGKKGKKNKVLVITNTVNKAIEVYMSLKKKGYKNIHLLHSRFILKDKEEKEKEIRRFSKDKNAKGIWITTQMAEASLDIDFDEIYTEMSTLDSLFQRLGRCFRNREYEKKEPNVYIYTKEVTGIGSVYDKKIHENSIDLLKLYKKEFLEEQDKIDLVDRLYSKEMLEKTEFLNKFEEGMHILDNIVDYETSKKEAQKLLRNIDNVTVIPKRIYDENLDLFHAYEKEENRKNRFEIKRKINKLTATIRTSQMHKIKGRIIQNPYIKDLYIADLKYDKEIGLLLVKDEEYELDEKVL